MDLYSFTAFSQGMLAASERLGCWSSHILHALAWLPRAERCTLHSWVTSSFLKGICVAYHFVYKTCIRLLTVVLQLPVFFFFEIKVVHLMANKFEVYSSICSDKCKYPNNKTIPVNVTNTFHYYTISSLLFLVSPLFYILFFISIGF